MRGYVRVQQVYELASLTTDLSPHALKRGSVDANMLLTFVINAVWPATGSFKNVTVSLNIIHYYIIHYYTQAGSLAYNSVCL